MALFIQLIPAGSSESSKYDTPDKQACAQAGYFRHDEKITVLHGSMQSSSGKGFASNGSKMEAWDRSGAADQCVLCNI